MGSKLFCIIMIDFFKVFGMLCKEILEIMQGFGVLSSSVMKVGVFSELDKELLVFVIGVIQCCDGCFGYYVKVLICFGVICE